MSGQSISSTGETYKNRENETLLSPIPNEIDAIISDSDTERKQSSDARKDSSHTKRESTFKADRSEYDVDGSGRRESPRESERGSRRESTRESPGESERGYRKESKRESTGESERESLRESERGYRRESKRESTGESERGYRRESTRESPRESERESLRESERGSLRESERESLRELERESPKEKKQKPKRESMLEPRREPKRKSKLESKRESIKESSQKPGQFDGQDKRRDDDDHDDEDEFSLTEEYFARDKDDSHGSSGRSPRRSEMRPFRGPETRSSRGPETRPPEGFVTRPPGGPGTTDEWHHGPQQPSTESELHENTMNSILRQKKSKTGSSTSGESESVESMQDEQDIYGEKQQIIKEAKGQSVIYATDEQVQDGKSLKTIEKSSDNAGNESRFENESVSNPNILNASDSLNGHKKLLERQRSSRWAGQADDEAERDEVLRLEDRKHDLEFPVDRPPNYVELAPRILDYLQEQKMRRTTIYELPNKAISGVGSSKQSAKEYIMQHKLENLFNMFLSALVSVQPNRPVDFLHDMAREMNKLRLTQQKFGDNMFSSPCCDK